MKSIVVFVVILFASVSTRSLKFHICDKKGIECLDKNNYVFCPKPSGFAFDQRKCSRGYVCQEGASIWNPCVPESEEDSNSHEEQESPVFPPGFHICTKKGFECLTTNTFAYCPKPLMFIIERFHIKKCPRGYVCQEETSGWYPCIPKRDNDRKSTTIESTSSTTTESTTESQRDAESVKTTEEESGRTTEDAVTSRPNSSTAENDNNSDTQGPDGKTSPATDITDQTTIDDNQTTQNEEQEETNTKEEDRVSSNADVTTAETEINNGESEIATNTKTEVATTGNGTTYPPIDDKHEVEQSEIITTESPLEVDAAGLVENVSQIDRLNPPECSGLGLFSGPSCGQYYECVSYFWFFYRPELKTCPTGESFSIVESRCVPSAQSDCID